jgi:hypothetical protein
MDKKPHNTLVVGMGHLDDYDPELGFKLYRVEDRTPGWQDLLIEKYAKERAKEAFEDWSDFKYEEDDEYNENVIDYNISDTLIFSYIAEDDAPIPSMKGLVQYESLKHSVNFSYGTTVECWIKKDKEYD